MRSYRIGCVIPLLLLVTPLWAQQSTSAPAQTTSDIQAVAVVQAAIAALGGATAISQVQNWTFQAQMQGLHGTGNVSYSLSVVVSPPQATSSVNGARKKTKASRSFFISAVLGYVLWSELQSQEFPLKFTGEASLGSESVKVVTFSDPDIPALPAQRWYFDTATNLPARVEFNYPAVVGPKISVSGVIEVSNYQPVAGILYPFKIITISEREQAEVLVLDSVRPSASTLPNDLNAIVDDSR